MAKKRKSKALRKSKTPKRAQKRSAARKARKAAPSRGRKTKAKTKLSSRARAATRKAPARTKPRRAAASRRSSAKKKAPARPARRAAKPRNRLPQAKRHAVESDEPRERAGDANERAFVGARTGEDEAKELGEEFVRSVTSGEEAESEMEEEEAVEEEGGPFVVTSASTEYGFGTDESNPPDAEKAPFPQVSPGVSPRVDSEDEDQ